ncbi:MAG: ABC transporter substrate-binding protein [Betaproteobacteria bacterium]|nr:ABC transporter substrate-binding protein [Betaproteobacteria bacterium]
MATRRSFLKLGLAVTAAAASGSAMAQSKAGKSVIFRVGLLGDVQTLNFWASNDINVAVLQEAVMPRYGYMDADGNVKSRLIRQIDVKEGARTFIVHVTPGLKWHDGVPFSADDVIFTGEYLVKHKLFQNTRFSNVASARKIDNLTVEYQLKAPQVGFADVMLFWVAPMPKHRWETVADPMTVSDDPRGVVGLGPYKLSEWKKGQHYIANRNPDWPAALGTPAIDRVVYRVYKDENSIVLALRTGEIDATSRQFLPSMAGQFRKKPEFRIFEIPSPGYSYIGFNGKKSEFAADLAVRKAIAHCVDRPKIVKLALEGNGVPMHGSVSPVHKDFVKSKIEYPPYDLDAAKKLLRDAGYADTDGDGIVEKNGRKLSIKMMYEGSRNDYDKSVRIIKEDARKAGIDLVLEPVDRQVYIDRQSKTKEYEMLFVQWGAIVIIYDTFYNIYGKDSFLNYSGFHDPDLEKWAKNAKESGSVAESVKPMDEAQKVVVNQIPTLAVWVPNLIFVNSARFDGYLPYPSSNNGTITLSSLLNIKPRK